MNNQDLKKQIRRRLRAKNKEVFAEYFTTCPKCKGTKKICVSGIEGNVRVEELKSCAKCAGEGFIDKVDA